MPYGLASTTFARRSALSPEVLPVDTLPAHDIEKGSSPNVATIGTSLGLSAGAGQAPARGAVLPHEVETLGMLAIDHPAARG